MTNTEAKLILMSDPHALNTTLSLLGELQPKYKYKCSVCATPNNYWVDYCKDHENEVDREVDEATDV